MFISSRTNTDQSPTQSSQKERRRNKRIELSLFGRFLDEQSEEHPFQILDISCSGAVINSDFGMSVGANIVCYIDELGRVAATVTRQTANGFAVSFKVASHKRDKLADRLTWLLNKTALGLDEDRASPRHTASGSVIITRQDGRQLQCTARDISLTGASFITTGPAPHVGEHISTGNIRGCVVRSERGHFAIRYLQKGE